MVDIDGVVRVTAPVLLSKNYVDAYVRKHGAWIYKRQQQASQRNIIKVPKKDIPVLKEKTARIIKDRLGYFAAQYGYSYKKVSIRDQKTRWGSCSRSGNLNFNYKIALLPEKLIDYIVIHELCHLKELNHSKNFWNLVARACPEHLLLRKELRRTHIVTR
ncbi:MAG: putative metal-dependent hydrolase [Candidatus Kaiserbacteria bacterium]|nr:putative metal-dependent hydrolase [Candidatus Kaiserbacteria bacterium]